jgi:hypothetical protein
MIDQGNTHPMITATPVTIHQGRSPSYRGTVDRHDHPFVEAVRCERDNLNRRLRMGMTVNDGYGSTITLHSFSNDRYTYTNRFVVRVKGRLGKGNPAAPSYGGEYRSIRKEDATRFDVYLQLEHDYVRNQT